MNEQNIIMDCDQQTTTIVIKQGKGLLGKIFFWLMEEISVMHHDEA